MLSLQDFQEARRNIAACIKPTDVTFSPLISEKVGHAVYLKWESKQRTGSFKERGVINFLSTLSSKEHARGVCAASAGNHALALATYSSIQSIPCTIVMPVIAPLVKVNRTREAGARVVLQGQNFDEAHAHAKDLAVADSLIFVPAFDDERIIAGQGSIGLEILEQLPDVDAVVATVGGGGLLSGISAVLKLSGHGAYVLGVQSEWALAAQQKTGHNPLSVPSIADGIAVKRPGQLTRPYLDKFVDQMCSASETAIAAAIVDFLELERSLAEGAAAAALAAVRAHALPANVKKSVLIVSGGNIDMNVLARLIQTNAARSGMRMRLSVSVPDRPGSLNLVTSLIAATGANVLEVLHERSFVTLPGAVDIMFLLETRDSSHADQVLNSLNSSGIASRIVQS
jgi:threonine dehydratase